MPVRLNSGQVPTDWKRHMDHSFTDAHVPRRLHRFLVDNQNARVSVYDPALRSRVPHEDLPTLLKDAMPLPFAMGFGVDDFATAIRLAHQARSAGSAHTLVHRGDRPDHLSAVISTDNLHVIFVRHSEGGVGDLADFEITPELYRGTCDQKMCVTDLDRRLQPLFGHQASENPRLDSLVGDESFSDLVDCWIDAAETGTSSCSVQLADKDGHLDDWFQLTFFDRGHETDFVLINTADNLRVRRNKEARNRLNNISETIPHGIFRLSTTGYLIYKNSRANEFLGGADHLDTHNIYTTEGEALNMAARRLLKDGLEAQVDIRSDLDGEDRILRLRFRQARSITGELEFAGSIEDVTEAIEKENQLEIAALTDAMTGASNRRALEAELADLLAVPGQKTFAVMLLDLDGFKQVNDSLGHSAGDEVIVEFGKRLLEARKEGDLVARLGGDEFVFVMGNVRDYDDAMEFADSLLETTKAPFLLDGRAVHLSGSIGVAMPDSDTTVHSILQMADHAMYAAKRAGRNHAVPYHVPDAANSVSPLALHRDLREAIADDTLELAFQPIFAIEELDDPHGFEALLRWDHPSMGEMDSTVVVSLAERSGLMGDLGEWVIDKAVRAAAGINAEREEDKPAISMNVNVSALQVVRPNFVETVIKALDENELDPQLLTIELTDSYLMDQLSPGRVALNAITEKGVRLAIDDFGTGFSTFEYLATMKVRSLKIDPSFAHRLSDPRANALLRGLGQACRELSMSMVVGGIETAEELERARQTEATHVQGFLLGEPALWSRELLRGSNQQNSAA